MKILYVITSTAAGGAENALLSLAIPLSKNHSIKIVSLKHSGLYADELKKRGIEVVSLEMGYWPRPRDLKRLKKIISDFKPDVVHALLFRAIQMCRALKGRFKLFTTPHTNYQNKSKFLRLVDAALKSRDTMSLAESRSTADFLLVNQRYNKNKVKVILNSVTGFGPDAAARQKLRAEQNCEDKIIFITVARLEKIKGHRFLLDGFAKIYSKKKNAVLWFVGDGAERENLAAAAAALGVKKAVKFWGYQKDIAPFLNAADVFILPSSSESRPLALLEAAACGLPLIAADTGDNRNVVRHGQNGFICNVQDPVMLAAVMGELADNKKLREEFGSKSLEISAELSNNYAEEHLKVYT
ncbi:MAG: glycosyltransferase [Elusimicrobium sp.]|jgi:glycosyltransferase involved in cell wall biosynthesis|nr:glycosyltransferase [Elusimicrobium sp.]